MEFVDLKSFHPNNLDEEAYAKFIEKWAFTVEVQWQKSEDPKIHELYSKCKGRAGLKGLALVLGRINTTIEIEDNFSMENNKIFKIPAKFLKMKHRRINAKPEMEDILLYENEEQYVKQFPKSFHMWLD